MARSLTVPLIANFPMSPPGKNIGVMTYESVLKAMREPLREKIAPSCSGSSRALRNWGSTIL